MQKYVLYAAVIFTVIAMQCRFASAYAVKVSQAVIGNPHHPAALAQELQREYRHGVRVITIRPGVYHLPATGKPTFSLNHWKNATIQAYGVTLIIHANGSGDCFDLNHCRGVTLAGPTISQTQVTFYQGRVMSVKRTGHRYTCIWKPDAGYPFPDIHHSRKFPRGFDVVNGRTRHLRVGSGDIWVQKFAVAGRHSFRLTFNLPHPEFKVGDFLVARWGNAPFKVHLNDSRDCTIKDVTLMRNGFAPIFETGGGANRIIACRWVLGPKPPGARIGPVVTNQADGFHCVNSYPGPTLENCLMRGVFLDDCIAIHGEFQTVVASHGATIIVDDNRDARLTVGQPIQISSIHGFFATSTVLSIHRFQIHTHREALLYDATKPMPGAGNHHHPPGVGAWLSRVRLAGDLNVPRGAYVTNPLRCGAGYKIIGCRLGDTRSRGMLLKGSDGLIENNVVRGCGMAGISIGPEVWWREAGYCNHVTVIGNKLIRDGKSGPGGFFAAIFVHGRGAIGNSHILIERNNFVSDFSGDIFMQWTRHANIDGNAMTAPDRPAFPGEKRQPAVVVKNCRQITVLDNKLTNPSRFVSPPIVIK
jgi:hypothetical protein